MGVSAKNPYENDDELEGQEARAGEVDGGVTVQGIHHIAIAVVDMDLTLDHYRNVFGLTVETREILDEEGIDVATLLVGGVALQLIAPTRDDADLAAYLDEWGPGLHHLGFTVEDVASATVALEAEGYEAVDTEPHVGPAGSQVVYVNPHDIDGTIIQLVED